MLDPVVVGLSVVAVAIALCGVALLFIYGELHDFVNLYRARGHDPKAPWL